MNDMTTIYLYIQGKTQIPALSQFEFFFKGSFKFLGVIFEVVEWGQRKHGTLPFTEVLHANGDINWEDVTVRSKHQ